MANSSRITIKLQSTAEGSSYFITSEKNTRNTTEKIQIKKFDPTVRQHVIFKETSKASK
jgi:large subunit ribosomal protein L33